MLEVLQSGAWGIYFLPKQWPPSFFQVVGSVLSLLRWVLCQEHHEEHPPSGGAGCKLLTPQPNWGRGVVVGLGLFKLQHCRSPTQTGCTEEMADLPGCACCSLNVLNQGHSLGTPCLGSGGAAGGSSSWELLDKREWRKKNPCELFETI